MAHADLERTLTPASRVAIQAPAVRIRVDDVDRGEGAPDAQTNEVAFWLSLALARALEQRGLAVSDGFDPAQQAPTERELGDLRSRYDALAADLFAQRKRRRNDSRRGEARAVQRRVELGPNVGLGTPAAEMARRLDADLLLFADLQAWSKTKARRNSDLVGSLLLAPVWELPFVYARVDGFSLELTLIDGRTGDALWAHRAIDHRVPDSRTVDAVVRDMFSVLPNPGP